MHATTVTGPHQTHSLLRSAARPDAFKCVGTGVKLIAYTSILHADSTPLMLVETLGARYAGFERRLVA